MTDTRGVVNPFVGEHRAEVVRQLVDDFQAVAAEESPRAVLLEAPPGWGKTRIVQEFYAEIAAQQPPPPYWPPRLEGEAADPTHARKEIFPSRVNVPPEAAMPWLWWGLSCTKSGANKPLGALLNATDQFTLHAGHLLRRKERVKALTVGAIEGFGRIAGLLGLGIPISDIAGLPKKVGAAVSTAREWQRDRSWQREGGELDVGGGSDLGLAQDLASSVAKLSKGGPPVIVVVEDAHDADPTSVRFLDLLTCSEKATVFVVATGRTSPLHTQAAEAPDRTDEPTFGAWFADVTGSGEGSEARHHRWMELDPLSDDNLSELVRYRAPHTEPDIVDALVERAGGNPFVLQLLLDLPSVCRSTVDGAVRCSQATLSRLPTEVTTLYQDIFAAFPEHIRTALCIAAVQGAEFSTGFVEQMGECIGDVNVVGGLREAEEPKRWVRRLDELVREFREAAIYEVCRDRQPEVLTEDEQHEALQRLLDHVRAQKLDASWHQLSGRGQRALLASHIWLVQEEVAPVDESAADSAHRLAVLNAAEHDWLAALASGRQALEWQRRIDDTAPPTLRYGMFVVEACEQVGDAQQRLSVAREMRDLHVEQLGAGHEDSIRTKLVVSEALRAIRDVESALEAGQEALDDAADHLGQFHALTIECRTALAWSLQVVGDVHAAVEVGRRAVDDAITALGREHPITLTCSNNLARYLRSAGDHGEAVRIAEETLAARERRLGPDHPKTIVSRGNLAWIYRADGQYSRALEVGRTAFENAKEILGEHHPTTLSIQTTMSTFSSANGYIEEAITYAQEAVAKRTRVLGPTHPLTINSRATLANALRKAGRFAEAAELGEEVLAFRERLLGLDHPTTLRSCISVAAAHRRTSPPNVDRATELTRRAYRAHVDRWGPDHPDTLKAQAALAVSLRAAGDVDTAIELGRDVLRRREARLGAEHPDTLTARAALARSYRSADMQEVALELAEATLQSRRAVLSEDHPDTRGTARLVDRLRRKLGARVD